jgi:hypothetical protein
VAPSHRIALTLFQWSLYETDRADQDLLLKTAITCFGLTPYNKSVSLKPGWEAPPIESAPMAFQHWYTRYDLWITDRDVWRYFPAAGHLVTFLVMLESSEPIPRRFLYHVWALVRDHASLEIANISLEKFRASIAPCESAIRKHAEMSKIFPKRKTHKGHELSWKQHEYVDGGKSQPKKELWVRQLKKELFEKEELDDSPTSAMKIKKEEHEEPI